MATPFIGPYSFTGWDGVIVDATRRSSVVRRPNYNGVGIVFDAWEAALATITTVSRYSASDPIPDLRSLVNTDLDVIDPAGQRWTCTVVNVAPGMPQALVDGTLVQVIQWTLLPTTEVPDASVTGAL